MRRKETPRKSLLFPAVILVVRERSGNRRDRWLLGRCALLQISYWSTINNNDKTYPVAVHHYWFFFNFRLLGLFFFSKWNELGADVWERLGMAVELGTQQVAAVEQREALVEGDAPIAVRLALLRNRYKVALNRLAPLDRLHCVGIANRRHLPLRLLDYRASHFFTSNLFYESF